MNVKNTLSLEAKVQVLEKLDKGVQENRLALDFNVSGTSNHIEIQYKMLFSTHIRRQAIHLCTALSIQK